MTIGAGSNLLAAVDLSPGTHIVVVTILHINIYTMVELLEGDTEILLSAPILTLDHHRLIPPDIGEDGDSLLYNDSV